MVTSYVNRIQYTDSLFDDSVGGCHQDFELMKPLKLHGFILAVRSSAVPKV